MKFVLKDGFIHIVNSEGIANNKLEAEVVTKYVDDYKVKHFDYRINNGDYKPLVNNRIEFIESDYNKGVIHLEIRSTKDGKLEYFTADRIPVTFAVIFGKRIPEAYPEVIKHILDRMDRMDIVLANMIDAMEEVDKKGDLF